jgi:hypothetical protein
MVSNNRIASGLQDWVKARQRHRLSHAHVRMARELGMNSTKLGKVDNHRQEPWKAPLPICIEDLYFKRFGRHRPETIVTMEEWAAAHRTKNTALKEAKRARAEEEKRRAEASPSHRTVGVR